MTKFEQIYDTGRIDWRNDKVYDEYGNLMTRSSWNQTGDGGGNARLFKKVDEPSSAEAKQEQPAADSGDAEHPP